VWTPIHFILFKSLRITRPFLVSDYHIFYCKILEGQYRPIDSCCCCNGGHAVGNYRRVLLLELLPNPINPNDSLNEQLFIHISESLGCQNWSILLIVGT
jgi:hypothetical protein